MCICLTLSPLCGRVAERMPWGGNYFPFPSLLQQQGFIKHLCSPLIECAWFGAQSLDALIKVGAMSVHWMVGWTEPTNISSKLETDSSCFVSKMGTWWSQPKELAMELTGKALECWPNWEGIPMKHTCYGDKNVPEESGTNTGERENPDSQHICHSVCALIDLWFSWQLSPAACCQSRPAVSLKMLGWLPPLFGLRG